MDKFMRVFIAIALVPAFVFMATALCACPHAEAAKAPLHENVPVLKADHSCCCPEGHECDTDLNTMSKDAGIESAPFTLNTSLLNIQAFEVVSFLSMLKAQTFSPHQLSLPSLEQGKLTTVQLLI